MYLLNPLIGKRTIVKKGEKMDETKKRDSASFITLEDTQHVAFLKMLGYRVVPWIESSPKGLDIDPNSKRVQFQVYGNIKEIEADMQKFYANNPFPIQTFCRHLKDVKSAMYSLRRIKET